MKYLNSTLSTAVSLMLFAVLVTPSFAQDKKSKESAPSEEPAVVVPPEMKERFAALEKMLTNVKLTGLFTVDGKPMKDLNEESYEIKSAKKLPDDNLWEISARIKYSKFDVTVPLVLNIEWAGTTPMISIDRLTIPGMGTFSARVLFHDNKYAGTWQHDSVGGHLFGKIEPNKPASE